MLRGMNRLRFYDFALLSLLSSTSCVNDRLEKGLPTAKVCRPWQTTNAQRHVPEPNARSVDFLGIIDCTSIIERLLA